jgi:hypothetical protein
MTNSLDQEHILIVRHFEFTDCLQTEWHIWFLFCSCVFNTDSVFRWHDGEVPFDFYFVAAFLTQTVCLDDTTVKFEIWDTAGQERYHSLAPMYYRGAQAAIVVYDITNQVSCKDEMWL